MLFAGEWMNADHHVEQDNSHSKSKYHMVLLVCGM
jgi:hypothetical protein